MYRVWLGDGLDFKPGPSFRTLHDANRFAMSQPRPELCSVECPDGSWVSPGKGIIREVLSWREPMPEVRPAPANRTMDEELKSYLADVEADPMNRRSSRRIRVQHRAELVLQPGRMSAAYKPQLISAIADASDTGLGLRLVNPSDEVTIRTHDPLWIRIEGQDNLELPGRIAWTRDEALGVRIRIPDLTIEERYHTWLQRAAFAKKLSDEP